MAAQLDGELVDNLAAANLASEAGAADHAPADPDRVVRELAAGPVPASLVHGDCHRDNVGIRADGSIQIFDWSDGALGHPFMDLAMYLIGVPEADREVLRAAYLAEWASFAEPDVLAELLRKADVLAGVYQVVTSMGIGANLELAEREPFLSSPSRWWLRILDGVEALAARDHSTWSTGTTDIRSNTQQTGR